jgi:hypothetical protein
LLALPCSPYREERDNITETASLAILALITAVLGSLSFPLDGPAQVPACWHGAIFAAMPSSFAVLQGGMSAMVFLPALVFFAVIARDRVLGVTRRYSTKPRESTGGGKQEPAPLDAIEMASSQPASPVAVPNAEQAIGDDDDRT